MPTLSELREAAKPPLPFVAGAPAQDTDEKPALPFVAGAPAQAVERTARVWGEDAFRERTDVVVLPAPPPEEVLPFHPPPPLQPPPQEEHDEPPTLTGSFPPVPVITKEPTPPPAYAAVPTPEAEDSAPFDVPPPAMIGPLARGQVVSPEETAATSAEPGAPIEALAAPPSAQGPAGLSIERAAAIAAEIAEERAPRAEVLRENGLTEDAWAAAERHWKQAIDEAAARGSSKLRGESDSAYVAAVERFRGPITAEEYARILIGLELGRANQVLDELEIQRPALMRIVRLWTKKIAKDAKLTEAVRAHLAKMRSA